MRILVVEDDATLSEQIRVALSEDGRAVDIARDGQDGAFLGSTETYDAIVLDLGLPIKDGISVLTEWRATGMDAPVLILTARDGWSDRVDGLDAGADDYLVKPFHMAELSARLRALIRRGSGRLNPVFEHASFKFDTRNGQAFKNDVRVDLTSHEAKVLSFLVHNAGRFVSSSELSEHIYPYESDRDSNTIAVFVARLRKKLGSEILKTERGRGYMIEDRE